MQYVGFGLIGLAVCALIWGLLSQMKMKKILAAPFKKTGEIAANPQVADAKGNISCEGAVQVSQPFNAPVSGKPCIYYEVKIERMWEKWTNTEDGQKKTTGSSTVSETKNGTTFFVNDGSGPVGVDAREKVDAELSQSFQQVQNVSSGDIYFGPGNFHQHVAYHGGEEHTTGIRCTEKIIEAEGNVFIMGKLAGGTITKEDGMLGKLLVSKKGRDALVGSKKTAMMVGYIVGGVSMVAGIPISIFMDPPKLDGGGGSVCANMENAMKPGDKCTGRVTDDKGVTLKWKVTKPGGFAMIVEGTGKSANMRLWPHITVVSKTGDEIADAYSSSGGAKLTGCVDKGEYTIMIRDVTKGHVGGTIKGGAGYSLEIRGDQSQKCDFKEEKKGDDKADDDAKKGPKTVTCSDKYADLSKDNGKSFTVICPKSCTAGSVYGTGTYTGDSPVCVAAVHSGAIKADDGGAIDVKEAKALKAYVGSKKNGVTTTKWGAYDPAYTVETSTWKPPAKADKADDKKKGDDDDSDKKKKGDDDDK